MVGPDPGADRPSPNGDGTAGITCCSIAGLGRGQGWQWQAHGLHATHRMIWINRGNGRVEIDGARRGFGPNSAIFLPAGTVHGFDFGPACAGWIISIPRSLPLPADFPDKALQATITGRDAQTELIALCDEIDREARAGHAGRDLALICRAGLLSVWLSRHMPREDAAETRATALMRRFIQRVEERLGSADTVGDHAAALNVTPTHLSRISRQKCGKSASEVIQARMLLEARRRLADTDTKIARIAADLGFSSPAYFTRLFAAKTGQSPSGFRRMARGLPDTGSQRPRVASS